MNSERESISFDPTGIAIDAVSFEHLASEARSRPDAVTALAE
jgi:hypothetical protein